MSDYIVREILFINYAWRNRVLLVDISVQIGNKNMLVFTLEIHSDMTGL